MSALESLVGRMMKMHDRGASYFARLARAVPASYGLGRFAWDAVRPWILVWTFHKVAGRLLRRLVPLRILFAPRPVPKVRRRGARAGRPGEEAPAGAPEAGGFAIPRLPLPKEVVPSAMRLAAPLGAAFYNLSANYDLRRRVAESVISLPPTSAAGVGEAGPVGKEEPVTAPAFPPPEAPGARERIGPLFAIPEGLPPVTPKAAELAPEGKERAGRPILPAIGLPEGRPPSASKLQPISKAEAGPSGPPSPGALVAERAAGLPPPAAKPHEAPATPPRITAGAGITPTTGIPEAPPAAPKAAELTPERKELVGPPHLPIVGLAGAEPLSTSKLPTFPRPKAGPSKVPSHEAPVAGERVGPAHGIPEAPPAAPKAAELTPERKELVGPPHLPIVGLAGAEPLSTSKLPTFPRPKARQPEGPSAEAALDQGKGGAELAAQAPPAMAQHEGLRPKVQHPELEETRLPSQPGQKEEAERVAGPLPPVPSGVSAFAHAAPLASPSAGVEPLSIRGLGTPIAAAMALPRSLLSSQGAAAALSLDMSRGAETRGAETRGKALRAAVASAAAFLVIPPGGAEAAERAVSVQHFLLPETREAGAAAPKEGLLARGPAPGPLASFPSLVSLPDRAAMQLVPPISRESASKARLQAKPEVPTPTEAHGPSAAERGAHRPAPEKPKAWTEARIRAAFQGTAVDEDEELRELKKNLARILGEEARMYYGSEF